MTSLYKWFVVGLLWFVCFFNYADRQAIFSVFPLLKADLHLSDVQLSIAGAAFMWMYALTGPFAGWLGDRLSRKGLIIGALLFWSCMTAATALSGSYHQLTFWRALGGLGEAFYFPAAMSLISDYHGSDTRSRAMALHQSSVYAGSIAGGTLSGYLGETHGWHWSFVFFGACGIVLAFVLIALLREVPRTRSTQSLANSQRGLIESLSDILKNSNAVLLILAFIGANFVAVVFLSWMPSFLYRKFHLSLSVAGFSSTAYLQLASVCGVLLGGIIADSWAKKRKGGRILTQALGLLCGIPFLLVTGVTLSLPVLSCALIGFGLFKGFYDANIFASLHDIVRPEFRAAATGLMNSLGWLGGGTAPILIAKASETYGMGTCLSATAAIYLAAGLLLLFTSWRVRRGQAS